MLVVTTLLSLLAFPASALKDTIHSSQKTGKIYSTTTDAYPQLGSYTDTFSYNTSTQTVEWKGVTEGVYTVDHAPSNISSGSCTSVTYVYDADGNMIKKYTTSTKSVTTDDNGYYSTTTGSADIKNVAQDSDGYRTTQTNITHKLTSKLYGWSGTVTTYTKCMVYKNVTAYFY